MSFTFGRAFSAGLRRAADELATKRVEVGDAVEAAEAVFESATKVAEDALRQVANKVESVQGFGVGVGSDDLEDVWRKAKMDGIYRGGSHRRYDF